MRQDCISHLPNSHYVQVHSDYRQILHGDAVAAAILRTLEYWAQAAIALNSRLEDAPAIWVGQKRISDFEEAVCGLSTDKQIRTRLKKLEERGFIQTKGKAVDGAAKSYCFMRGKVQEELDILGEEIIERGRSINRGGSVNQPRGVGQSTEGGSVNQPRGGRSINRASLYNYIKEEELRIKEELNTSADSVNTASAAARSHSDFSDSGGLCHEDIQQNIPLESQSTIEEKEKNPPAPRSSTGKRKKETEFTPDAFEIFWKEEVPLKSDKVDAKKRFCAVTDLSLDEMKSRYQASKLQYADEFSQKNPGKPTSWQFFPRLTAWINGKRWEDEAIADFLPSTEEAPVAVPSQPKPEYEEWVRLAILNGQIKDYRDGKIQTNRDLWKPLEQQYNSPNLAYLRTLEAARLEDLEVAS